ncbi:MAG: hypothetical protein N2109_00475 [Fimbriimonadales bacterium]|nr:hypothetical protein [Fimbriimonadales bacterium]
MEGPFHKPITIDGEALMRNLRREGTPARVHFLDLYLDREVQDAINERYGVWRDIDPSDPHAAPKRLIAIQRFLGYDYVTYPLTGIEFRLNREIADDTAELKREGGRAFVNEHVGPITDWESFERYPWPNADDADDSGLAYLNRELPDDMVLVAGLCGHIAENLTWLMGYETLCYALYDQPDLVEAIANRVIDFEKRFVERMLSFDRVQAVFASDDMGFRTGTLIGPDELRRYVLRGHRELARMTHDAGRQYWLHSCGKLDAILPDLLDDVKIDARHSFEDVIQPVTEAKRDHGHRVALLGGIDMDFLCRASEQEVRRRVRETLDVCQPGGGYCLGTGNSVANYLPIENYLAMLDEGRLYAS